MNFFQVFYLTHFSKPVGRRGILRHIQSDHPRKILEVGIQHGDRTVDILNMVLHFCGDKSDVHYCAIDPFEARTAEDGFGLSLRKAHRLISSFEIKSRLIPQAPEIAVKQLYLDRLIEKVDLAVISTPNLNWLKGSCTALAEIIHESAGIFIGIPAPTPSQVVFEKIGLSELVSLANHPDQLTHSRHSKNAA